MRALDLHRGEILGNSCHGDECGIGMRRTAAAGVADCWDRCGQGCDALPRLTAGLPSGLERGRTSTRKAGQQVLRAIKVGKVRGRIEGARTACPPFLGHQEADAGVERALRGDNIVQRKGGAIKLILEDLVRLGRHRALRSAALGVCTHLAVQGVDLAGGSAAGQQFAGVDEAVGRGERRAGGILRLEYGRVERVVGHLRNGLVGHRERPGGPCGSEVIAEAYLLIRHRIERKILRKLARRGVAARNGIAGNQGRPGHAAGSAICIEIQRGVRQIKAFVLKLDLNLLVPRHQQRADVDGSNPARAYESYPDSSP